MRWVMGRRRVKDNARLRDVFIARKCKRVLGLLSPCMRFTIIEIPHNEYN